MQHVPSPDTRERQRVGLSEASLSLSPSPSPPQISTNTTKPTRRGAAAQVTSHPRHPSPMIPNTDTYPSSFSAAWTPQSPLAHPALAPALPCLCARAPAALSLPFPCNVPRTCESAPRSNKPHATAQHRSRPTLLADRDPTRPTLPTPPHSVRLLDSNSSPPPHTEPDIHRRHATAQPASAVVGLRASARRCGVHMSWGLLETWIPSRSVGPVDGTCWGGAVGLVGLAAPL